MDLLYSNHLYIHVYTFIYQPILNFKEGTSTDKTLYTGTTLLPCNAHIHACRLRAYLCSSDNRLSSPTSVRAPTERTRPVRSYLNAGVASPAVNSRNHSYFPRRGSHQRWAMCRIPLYLRSSADVLLDIAQR